MTPATVLVTGNCHAAFLALSLARSTKLNVALVGRGAYAFMLNVAPGRVTYLGTPEATAGYVRKMRETGSRVLLVEQVTPRHASVEDDVKALFTPDDTAALVHAEVAAYFLQAYLGRTWRQDLEEGKLDRKVRRRLDIDKAAVASSLQRAGLDPDPDALLGDHQKTILFHTDNHPTETLLARLFTPILDKLVAIGAIGEAERADVARRLVDDHGISHVTAHPVHERVGEALELEWTGALWYQDWADAFTFVRARRYDDACEAAESALRDPACSQHVWALFGRALEASGDLTRAHQAYGAAYRAFPVNTAYCRAWIGSAPDVDRETALGVADGLRRSMRLWQRSQLSDELDLA